MAESWDAIVIGSGMGGLACAALLAAVGKKRVLVVEKQWTKGGLTHEFRRGPYSFDVGLHYVGGMGQGEPGRRLMDFITDGAVSWTPLPDPFEVFVYPGFRFAVPFSEAKYRAALHARFPGQQAAIDHYFRDVERAASWLGLQVARKAMPHWLDTVVDLVTPDRESLALDSTRTYLHEHVSDPLLRAVLASQWGDYGLAPAQSPFGLHAMVTQSYFSGAYFPTGGAHVIAEAVKAVLGRHGGEIRVGHDVTEILVERDRAVGVSVRHVGGGDEAVESIYAPLVVSDAGADITYLDLLPPEVDLWFRDEVREFKAGVSGVVVFLGLKSDPRRLGIAGENFWIYTGTDHDAMAGENVATLDGHPQFAMVSFPSTHDPAAHHHTAQILTEIDHESLVRWRAKHPGDLDSSALKSTIAKGLLDLVESQLPGLRDLVDVVEVATPFVMEHLTHKRHGALYGIPGVAEKFRQRWLDVETPVSGLLLTGSDVASLGIQGATMGGLLTASKVLGARVLGKIMAAK